MASHFQGNMCKETAEFTKFTIYYTFKGSHVKNLCTIVCYSFSVSSQHVPFSHFSEALTSCFIIVQFPQIQGWEEPAHWQTKVGQWKMINYM